MRKAAGIELSRSRHSGPEVRVVDHCAMAGSVCGGVFLGVCRHTDPRGSRKYIRIRFNITDIPGSLRTCHPPIFCFQDNQIQFSEAQMSIQTVFWDKEQESKPHTFASPVLWSELWSTALWLGQSPGASPRGPPGDSLFSVLIQANSTIHKHK